MNTRSDCNNNISKKRVFLGFPELDELISGVHSGELILIAARPCMGKTTFANKIVTNLAIKHQNVAFFSLENDTSGITVIELSNKARRMKEERGLDLIILDYLQLIQGDMVEDAMCNQQQDFSDIFSSLKSVARELNVPIIVLSQLPRSVEQRPTKRPKISDLRIFGDLELEADIIMFMYCEEFYFPETENKNITEISVAKNLRGSLGTVKLMMHE